MQAESFIGKIFPGIRHKQVLRWIRSEPFGTLIRTRLLLFKTKSDALNCGSAIAWIPVESGIRIRASAQGRFDTFAVLRFRGDGRKRFRLIVASDKDAFLRISVHPPRQVTDRDGRSFTKPGYRSSKPADVAFVVEALVACMGSNMRLNNLGNWLGWSAKRSSTSRHCMVSPFRDAITGREGHWQSGVLRKVLDSSQKSQRIRSLSGQVP
jgi:hypothetical protein